MSNLKNVFLGWILYLLMIPFVGANPATEPPTTTVAPATTPVTEIEQIDINTADAANLQARLEGIGEKKALAIIEFREKNGPFKVPADIMQVPGIGEKLFEKNKDRIITVLPSTDNAKEETTAPTTVAPAPPANEGTTETVPTPQSEEKVEAK